ncbi:MAG: TIGR01459 family HAD-type hydrolase [Alphaproteobacteria bacterium]|nr:TIGR01459 family HAD-type hydrolase [Alphaproteobacteria bacterium SS10]
MSKINGLASLIDRYDGFVIDQWGVLHDGQTPYPGALQALEHLQAAGKPFVILSNSGKRAVLNAERMARLGFPDWVGKQLLTSGELTWRALSNPAEALPAIAGRRLYLIIQPGENRLIRDTEWEQVDTVGDADAVLIAGLTAEATQEEYEPVLAQALERQLTVLCANPDFDALLGTKNNVGPGRLAAWYEQAGGKVIRFGKPEPDAFTAAREMLGVDGPALMIGDSLYHDIAGGSRAGLDTLFITGGIHASALNEPDPGAALQALYNKVGAVPTHRMQRLVV